MSVQNGEHADRSREGPGKEIAEQKQVEKALRESEEKFSKIFNASLVATSLTELDTAKYVEVNDEFLRISEWTREQVIGHTPLELALFVHPSIRASLIGTIKEKGTIANGEIEIRTKSGKVVHLLHSGQMILINEKKYLLSVASDITERKRAEEALRESEERFSKAFKTSPYAYMIANMEDGHHRRG